MDREGGLGIFMVKKMMDDVSYAYEESTCALRPLHALYPIFVSVGKARGHCVRSGTT